MVRCGRRVLGGVLLLSVLHYAMTSANPDLRALVKQAQRKDLLDEDPDRTMSEIATTCCVNRSHLFELMAGKTDPSRVRPWTIHRLAKGLDQPPQLVADAIKVSRRRAQSRERRKLVDG